MLRLKRLAMMVWLVALCAALAPERGARRMRQGRISRRRRHRPHGGRSRRHQCARHSGIRLQHGAGPRRRGSLAKAGFPAHRIIVSGKGKEQLSRRVAAAQALSPALVISIHHDSVQERYLEDWRFAGEPRRYSDRFAGFSIFVSRANPHFEQSLAFARALGRSLTAAGLRFFSASCGKDPGREPRNARRRNRRVRVPQSPGPARRRPPPPYCSKRGSS